MAARKQNANDIKLVAIPKRLMRADLERRLPAPNGRTFLNLTGRRFERCTAIGFAGFLGPNAAWLCRCNCGQLFVTRSLTVAHRPTGCGCGCASGRVKRYGASKLREYGPWYRMLRNHPGQVCRRWLNFANFWADVGPLPKSKKVLGRHNLRRPYGPNNAGWMSRGNASPSKGAKLYLHAGRSLAMKDWAKRIGITTERLRQRVERCKKHEADISEAFAKRAS